MLASLEQISENSVGNIRLIFLGQLYTFCILRVFFVKHITKYETLTIYFRISCGFRVLLLLRKNKLRNPLTFHMNANAGTKCCEMQKTQKKGCKMQKPRYTLFVLNA